MLKKIFMFSVYRVLDIDFQKVEKIFFFFSWPCVEEWTYQKEEDFTRPSSPNRRGREIFSSLLHHRDQD